MRASNAARHGKVEDPLRLRARRTRPSPFLAYELREVLGNLRQINLGEISESDDREFLFDVPRQDRFETLKRTVVAVYRLATFLSDLPCKSVGMRLAALEDDRRKDLRPAFRL